MFLFVNWILFFSFQESKEWWASVFVYAQTTCKFRTSYVSRRFVFRLLIWLSSNFLNSKLTNLIKLRETTKTSWLECALSIFQARYAASPPLGGNRRVSLSELCVLSAFLFYVRPDVKSSQMRIHPCRRQQPPPPPITIDRLIILVPLWNSRHCWTVIAV